MTLLRSKLETKSDVFRANAEAMHSLVVDLRSRTAQAARGGSEEARQKHLARGKLLVRDRIDALLDPGTPWLELSGLAAHGLYGGDIAAAGIITGIGRVSGRECIIVAT